MVTPALLLLVLLALFPGVPAICFSPTPFTIKVTNSVTNAPSQTYNTLVPYRGALLRGMRRLHESDSNFTFTYTEDPKYGPFLESVNGLPGSSSNHTYWELLVNTTERGPIRLNVGIGCYTPNANDQIILNYNTY